MKKRFAKAFSIMLVCAMVAVGLVACNGEKECISKIEGMGYSVEHHREADDVIDVGYYVLTNKTSTVYVVVYASNKAAKSAFGDGLLGGGMKDNPNLPRNGRYVFYGTPYSGYGDGAVRVGNAIVVGPMDVLRVLEKNENKILQ